MRILGRIAMASPLADAAEIDAEEQANQQEKQAADNPGPVRDIHFKLSQNETPHSREALCLMQTDNHSVTKIRNILRNGSAAPQSSWSPQVNAAR